ncbi:MAG TPA: hypothetical protein VEC12_03620 [Bacteroidia bacterium]|nr:hypothetical protein [Bacteroidia bacterium]
MTDIYLLYTSSVITFLVTLLLYRYNKKAFWVVLPVFIIYTTYFYYGLFYKGQYGSSLVWLVYLLVINSVHVLAVLGYVVFKMVRVRLHHKN